MTKTIIATFMATAALLLGTSGASAVNLVQNGDFESTSAGIGQLGYNTSATGWTTNGYNFLFAGDTADSTGSNGQYGNLKLWGPANGVANGLTGSPTGGNYVAADGAFGVAPIEQSISGLVAGQNYTVGFWWAGAQQYTFDGANTEQWEVKLGSGPSQFTAVYNNPSHGFSGWVHESFTFTAQSATETLSFLAHGTPEGVPPFSLLDGVTMNAVPEPASWAMMVVGFGVAGAAVRRRARPALA